MDRFFRDLEIVVRHGRVQPATAAATDGPEVHDGASRQMTIWVVDVNGRLGACRMFGDGQQFNQTFKLGRPLFSCTRSITGDVVETLRLLEVDIAGEAQRRGLGPIHTVNREVA